MNNNNNNNNDLQNNTEDTRLSNLRDAQTYDALDPSTWNHSLIKKNLTGSTQQEFNNYFTRELRAMDDDHEKIKREYWKDYKDHQISKENYNDHVKEEDEDYSVRRRELIGLAYDVAEHTNNDPHFIPRSTDSNDNNQDDSNQNDNNQDDNNQDDSNQNDNNQDDNHQDNRNPTGQTPLEYVEDIMDGEPMDVSDPDG